VRKLIRLRSTGALLFALALQSGAAEAAEVNVVSKVEVRGRAVEIVASRKPNFTTFTMTDPPRLVVDISEAVFAKVPEEMRVQNGTIRTIKTAGYGSGSSAIARVIVAFEHNVETDISAFGDNGLLVKILGDSGPPVVAAVESPANSPASVKRSSTPAAAAPAVKPVKPVAAEVADEEEPAPATAKAERAASPAEAKPAPVVAEAKPPPVAAQAKPAPAVANAKPAPSVVVEAESAPAAAAESEPLEEPKRTAELDNERARKQAEALNRQREEKEAKLREAEARRQAKEERQRQIAVEAQKKKEEQRLAKQLERERAQAETERRKQAAVEKKKEIEEARLAKRLETQERAKAEQERRRQARVEGQRKEEAARLARRLEQERTKAAKQSRRQVKVAAVSTVRSDAVMDESAPLRRQRPAGGRSLMTFVGFIPQPSGSRVFVRTSGPVRYSVTQGGDKTVVLELENARINVHNNTRPLDTSQFDSPVERIEPHQAAGQTVRVQIRLRDAVPYQAKQEGNEVFLDFGPPAHP